MRRALIKDRIIKVSLKASQKRYLARMIIKQVATRYDISASLAFENQL